MGGTNRTHQATGALKVRPAQMLVPRRKSPGIQRCLATICEREALKREAPTREMIFLALACGCFFPVVQMVSSADSGNMRRTCALGALSVAQSCWSKAGLRIPHCQEPPCGASAHLTTTAHLTSRVPAAPALAPTANKI